MPDGSVKLEGFDAELAAALDEIGRRVRPHEFDSPAIMRRAARRRAGRMLAASAAGLAVVVGATALAARPDNPATNAVQKPTAAAPATSGTDPLDIPGYFRSAPGGGDANGFSQLGGTTDAMVYFGGSPSEQRIAQTDWTYDGVALTGQVIWRGTKPVTELSPNDLDGVAGTINGRTAYYEVHGQEVVFWTGSQGYATAMITGDADGAIDGQAMPAALLSLAKSLVPAPTAMPMPIRVTGLASATVSYAGIGWTPVVGTEPWYANLELEYDGMGYGITAAPGSAAIVIPHDTFTPPNASSASKTIDGVNIVVSTNSVKPPPKSAPTVAQILADVTSLGLSPSGWTTDVLVK